MSAPPELTLGATVAEWRGTVVATQANFYRVRLDGSAAVSLPVRAESERPRELLCTRRARLKKLGQRVIAGDRVTVEEPDWTDGRGAIASVLPRRTELSRPPVANADVLLLMFALAAPPPDAWQLSRFLTCGETTGLELCLCLNKCDLVAAAEQQAWRERLRAWGYDPLFVSIRAGDGLEAVRARLAGKIGILAGPSGVGKSSAIARLVPSAQLRIGSVSGKLERGRHTTRHVELFELPGGGLLADTPGFNQPVLDCPPQRVVQLFPEARAFLRQGNCQFGNCLHRDEPHCVVRGEWERYEHYLRFLDEAVERAAARRDTPDTEINLKLKTGSAGQREYEPKLESKKYRRTSRRQRHQSLQDLIAEAEVEEL
ncbi:ribosome small subunit-dependent GTPase A [Rubidibacter lacunae KORDI 51-2]|uniref:Small ribosomal subunit biogenesis GTPase RsgA n=1 Tax=Rubidibacter lacunae KORDI 51-2 TaxID=582515 RepID=U5DLZ5_9CHRO|nr:small ribosomal subunit biogenesis GTPase RsgA [Rubidibacter lacunae]ERN40735.1 ribosome small subunit-dependent GTPase A [Rubidibacter lacunae KORDI 51-2]